MLASGWYYALVVFCCVSYGFNVQVSRWASQRISWYKIASLRYLVRGLVAAVGVILLITPMSSMFSDPDLSVARAAGVDTWSVTSLVVLLIFMFLVVTGAGYSVTYLMQRTPTPTVLSSVLSVGGILMTLLVGVTIFGETTSKTQCVGILLALVALPLLVFKPKK